MTSEQQRPSVNELRRLLLDPDCPYGIFLGGKGMRPLLVEDLLRFGGARLRMPASVLEPALTEYIASIGGAREPMGEWSIRRAIDRLKGKTLVPVSDVWLIPPGFFDQTNAGSEGS